MVTHENFQQRNNFQLAIQRMEEFMKTELLFALTTFLGDLGCGNWRASPCRVFESLTMNAIDMPLL